LIDTDQSQLQSLSIGDLWSQEGRNLISPNKQDPVVFNTEAPEDPLNKVIYTIDPIEQVIATDKLTILKFQDKDQGILTIKELLNNNTEKPKWTTVASSNR
jgi:hypothetical protein